jgi:anti-anti-sigma regulatory factor
MCLGFGSEARGRKTGSTASLPATAGYGHPRSPPGKGARLAEYEVSDREGDRVTLRLHGDLVGEESVDHFKESLERHYVDDGVKLIRVELSDLDTINLEGVAVLLQLYQESLARGKRFLAEGATGQVRDKLEITGPSVRWKTPSASRRAVRGWDSPQASRGRRRSPG